MNPRIRRWAWPTCKLLLSVLILAAVSWQFWKDLHDERLPPLTVQPAWLVASGVLYLVGMSFSARYWYRLLLIFGEQPGPLPAFRAF